MAIERVLVVGSGAWGTALAQASAMAGLQVSLLCRDSSLADEINSLHTNQKYLGDQKLSDWITADTRVVPADLVILAVPAQSTRAALHGHHGAFSGLPVLLTAKGLEHGTLKRQSEVLLEAVPEAIPYVLSGPSFAADVAAGRPTAVTLAGDDEAGTEEIAAALAGPSFRPYAAGDLIGVELAGALKNVYALAAGAVEGAGLGASARSSLIARSFAELTRLVEALGGHASTLTGLAGIGDLTLSCTSTQSRNYRAGIALGRGQAMDASLLAEGVSTAPVALKLARRAGVDAPLVEAVNQLLGGNVSIEKIVAGLMSRPLKREQ